MKLIALFARGRVDSHNPRLSGQDKAQGQGNAANLSREDRRRACGAKELNPCAETPRRGREWETVAAMVRSYCRHEHGFRHDLCPECRSLLDYATLRLQRCRFGEEKPTCANCPVHCYQRDRREQIREVMRKAGPRMVWEHPWLSIRHWLDGLRAKPARSVARLA